MEKLTTSNSWTGRRSRRREGEELLEGAGGGGRRKRRRNVGLFSLQGSVIRSLGSQDGAHPVSVFGWHRSRSS
jgi:hypothetical protein